MFIHDKLMVVGSELVKKTVEMILSGDVKTVAQSELISSDTVLKPAPKIFKEDCRLDFSKDGISIKNLVRGLSPYPAAFTTLKIKDKEYQKICYPQIEEEFCKAHYHRRQ